MNSTWTDIAALLAVTVAVTSCYTPKAAVRAGFAAGRGRAAESGRTLELSQITVRSRRVCPPRIGMPDALPVRFCPGCPACRIVDDPDRRWLMEDEGRIYTGPAVLINCSDGYIQCHWRRFCVPE